MSGSPGLELREHVLASEIDKLRRFLLLVFLVRLTVIFVRLFIGKNRDKRLGNNVVFDSGLSDAFSSGLNDFLRVVTEIAPSIGKVLL